MFSGSRFNGDISNWDVSNIRNMDGAFEDTLLEGEEPDWYFE